MGLFKNLILIYALALLSSCQAPHHPTPLPKVARAFSPASVVNYTLNHILFLAQSDKTQEATTILLDYMHQHSDLDYEYIKNFARILIRKGLQSPKESIQLMSLYGISLSEDKIFSKSSFIIRKCPK